MRRGRRLVRLGLLAVISTVAVIGMTGTVFVADAAESGSATLSVAVVPPPVRSILVETLAPNLYSQCYGPPSYNTVLSGLVMPGGLCLSTDHATKLTIGDVASKVLVRTSAMTATGAVPWQPVASNNIVALTTDRFSLQFSSGVVPPWVTAVDACDVNSFHVESTPYDCVTVAAGSVAFPRFELRGPSSSTSATVGPWSHTVTWTVTPP